MRYKHIIELPTESQSLLPEVLFINQFIKPGLFPAQIMLTFIYHLWLLSHYDQSFLLFMYFFSPLLDCGLPEEISVMFHHILYPQRVYTPGKK